MSTVMTIETADVRLVAYVTPAEHARLHEAARRDGRSLSGYIRRVLNCELTRVGLGPDDDPEPEPVAAAEALDAYETSQETTS